VIVYLRTSPELEQMLIERARLDPKPLYYRPEFLDQQLPVFMAERGYGSIDEIPPDEFVTWVFPRLFHARLPRYQAIADRYGYTLDVGEAAPVRDESDFLQLIAAALGR
jgi:hypothetical protein